MRHRRRSLVSLRIQGRVGRYPMKAIVAVAPDRVEIRDLPMPVPSKGEVRIRTAYCGICATDLSIIAGTDRVDYPFVPGHEWSGVVDAVGPGGDPGLIGRSCVAENVLADGGEVGFERPGGYGELFVTEARNLQLLAGEADMRAATLIEPLAVCVRGMKRLDAPKTQEVLVFGDGPIGLLMTALMRTEGHREVVVVGGRARRLDLAKALGASICLDYHNSEATGLSRRFSAIVEASGSAAAIRALWDLASPQARVLLIGDYKDVGEALPWQTLLHREISLIPSNASAGGWEEALGLARIVELPLARLISHEYAARSIDARLLGSFPYRYR